MAMEVDTTQHPQDPHPKLPSSLSREHVKTANTAENHVQQHSHTESIENLTAEDIAAAEALMALHRDSTFALRSLVNNSGGNVGKAVKTIIHQASYNPIEAKKPASKPPRKKKRVFWKKDELNAALTLISLSGQSRADSKAALTLLRLRRESDRILARAEEDRKWLAQLATEKRKEIEQSHALKVFREQYPAVLRTSSKNVKTEMPEDEGIHLLR